VRATTLTGSPPGAPVSLDAYGNPVYDGFIRRVVLRPDGKLWNAAMETYPLVDQFWGFDPVRGPSRARE